MTSNIKDIRLAQFFFESFGGYDKVEELGKVESFLNFYKDPYQIVIITPWSQPIDFISEGYELGSPFYILDESLNLLKDTTIRDPKIHINGKCYTEEGSEIDCDLNLSNTKLEPEGFREVIEQTPHGDFFVVNFADKFYSFWVKKKIKSDRKEKMINIWTRNLEKLRADRTFSRLGIELQNSKPEDKLVIKVARADVYKNVISFSEMNNLEDVQTIELDYFETPTFLYPETSWWMTFSINNQPISPISKTGLGISYFKETASNLFLLQLKEDEILARFDNASRQKNNQIKGLISFESPS